MTLRIDAIGTAVPRPGIPQPLAAQWASRLANGHAARARLIPYLFRKSGVRARHSVLLRRGAARALEQRFFQEARSGDDRGPTTAARMALYERGANRLAAAAAARAVRRAGCPPAAVTHVVSVSCSGFAAPGFDVHLIDRLGLDRGAARTHVGFMGCHGALNGLRVADAFLARPGSRVLLCAVELCSLHYSYRQDAGRIVANALFADGAAAAVLSPAGGGPWRLAGSSSYVFPDSRDAMTWRIGDHGFEMTLSPAVPDLLRAHLRAWVESWLAGFGLSPEDVATWAIHPGGPRVLDAAEDALRIARATTRESRVVLARYGNMSSPTLLFVLQRLRRRRAPLPCVALGFGPGLAAEGALFV